MAKIITGAAIIAGAIIGTVLTAGGLSGIWVSVVPALLGAAFSAGGSLLLAGVAQALHHDLGTNIALRQAAAPWTIVYGRCRVGGVIVYTSLTDDSNKYLHLVIVHCSHQVQAFNALWLDGKQVFMGGGNTDDGNTHKDPSGNNYNFHGHVYWETRPGTPTQTCFTSLNSHDSTWPLTATLAGHACSYIRLKYDAQIFPSGIPGIRVDIAGKNNIYDPRTATRGYTENWALVIADVLCDTNYGLQCNYATEIDETQLIAAANVCDESVPLANGAHEPRYTVNGVVTNDQAPGDILSSLMTAAAGRLTYVGGVWKIYPAYWPGVSLSLTDSDLIGGIQWSPYRKTRDIYNAVKGTFVCPSYPYISAGPGLPNNQKIPGIFDGQWKQTDVPPYMQDARHGYPSDANLAADGGTRYWLDTRFPFTISVAAAQRLMKILLLRNRQEGTGSLTCRLSAYRLRALDVIQFTHDRWASDGWSNKLLEISNFRLNFVSEKDKAPTISVEMDVQDSDPGVYTWSAAEELSIDNNPSPLLPLMTVITSPGGLTLATGPDEVIVSVDGIRHARIKATWIAPVDAFVTNGGIVELQYQQDGATDWTPAGRFDGQTTSTYISPVNDGITYNVRIRSQNVAGAYSDWIEANIMASLIYSLLSSGLNLLPNPDFEIAAQAPGDVAVAGWRIQTNDFNSWGWFLAQNFAFSGTNSVFAWTNAGVVIPNGGSVASQFVSTKNYTVRAGDEYYMSVYSRFDTRPGVPALVTSFAAIFLFVTYSDGFQEALFGDSITDAGFSDWKKLSGRVRISPSHGPPTFLLAGVIAAMFNNTGATYTTDKDFAIYFDGITLNNVADGNTAIRGSMLPTGSLATTIFQNSNSGGSCTIGFSWVSQTVLISNKDVFSAIGSSMTWTGLAGGTTYQFYLRGKAIDGTVHIGSGDPPATPPNAPDVASAMACYEDGWYPLGIVTVTTPATSGGSGSGHMGGSTCPEGEELVCVKDRGIVKVKDANVGDLIQAKDVHSGETAWRKIIGKSASPSSAWRVVNGRRLSPHEPIWIDGAWRLPFQLSSAVDTTKGVRVKLSVDGTDYDKCSYSLVDESGNHLLEIHNLFITS